MADLTKKQYLDLAGLKAFWGIIKDNFVSEVSLSMPVDGPAVFMSKDGLGNETTIGTIPMATTSKAGLMSKEQVAALESVSGNIEAAIDLKGVAFAGNAAKIASIGTGDDVKAKHVNLDVKYDSKTKTIQVVDLNNESAVLTSFDATAFIKDSFLSSAAISEKDGKTGLLLTFELVNPETGEKAKEPIFVDLTSFVDTYNAGNGLNVANKVFSIKLAEGEKYLAVDANGLATTGIDTAISTAASAAEAAAKSHAEEKAAAAETAAKSYADGLAVNYDAAGSAAQALTDAKAYVDPKFAAVAEEIGVKTGEGAPTGLYKEISDAEAAAKSYTDTEIEEALAGINNGTTGILASAKAYTDQEVGKVNATIGTVASGKTVVKMIEDAQEAAAKTGTDAAAQALTDAKKYTDDELATAKAELDKTDADNLAAAKTYAEEQAAAAQTAAEKHADDEIKNLKDTEIKALQDKVAAIEGEDGAIADALAAAKDYTDGKVAAAKTYAEEQAQAAKDYADGLKTAIDGVIEENEKVTSEALTDLDTRVKVLEEIDHEAYKDYVDGRIDISGKTVKAYVDDADATVLSQAKGYTDSSSAAVYAAIEAIPVANITLDNLNA